MRRHCNAISKKAFYDQLFIDTIVIAERSRLSKNISFVLWDFCFCFFLMHNSIHSNILVTAIGKYVLK